MVRFLSYETPRWVCSVLLRFFPWIPLLVGPMMGESALAWRVLILTGVPPLPDRPRAGSGCTVGTRHLQD